MIWLIFLLFATGVFFSAMFSGSETGFYRVVRIRLLLDGLGGDPVSRMLLQLTNQPALFVATTLIGNNVANYLMSLAIVLATDLLFVNSQAAETIAPLALSPLIFVYCELLPKQLFFYAPNRLLQLSGTLLLLCAILFAPVALVLWVLGWFLEKLLGQPPLRVRLALASKELQQVLREGKEAGILHATQHDLAQELFVRASQSIARFTRPLSRVISVPLGAKTADALTLARRQRSAIVPVRDMTGPRLVGYVRVIDLRLAGTEHVETCRDLPRIAPSQSHLGALIQLQKAKADVGLVEDADGNAVGLLYADHLTETFFPGM